MFQVMEDDELMLITNSGKVLRLKVNTVRIIGRNTQGVKLIGISPDEKVTGVARLAEKEDEEDKEDAGDEKPVRAKKAGAEAGIEEAGETEEEDDEEDEEEIEEE